MGLFTTDLFRSFALGFVAGALGLVAVLGTGGDEAAGGMVPHAVAASVSER